MSIIRFLYVILQHNNRLKHPKQKMNHKYYRQIIDLLTLRPEGLKVSAIAKNIYNQQGNLFSEQESYEKLYESIRQYLWQQSQKKNSIFTTVDNKRGYYKLRQNYTMQTEFQFASEDLFPYPCDNKKTTENQSAIQLSLYDEE